MKLAQPARAVVYVVILVSILYKALDYSGLHALLERKLETTYARVIHHIDWGYSWIFKPVFLYSFIFPFVVVAFLYSSAIFLHLYKRRHEIQGFIQNSESTDKWDWARCFLAALWEAQGSLWHGYDIQVGRLGRQACLHASSVPQALSHSFTYIYILTYNKIYIVKSLNPSLMLLISR